MKVSFLSFALCVTAAGLTAQTVSPTPAQVPSAGGNPIPRFSVTRKVAAPAPVAVADAAGPAQPTTDPVQPTVGPALAPMIRAVAPTVSADAHIENRPVDSSTVGEVHCKPLYISTIHLPEAVSSVAIGAPTLFTAEHVENEPRLVFVSPTTHDKAESNLLIALTNGETVSLKLKSSGTSTVDYDVDFVLDYTGAKELLAFAGPMETGIGGVSTEGGSLPMVQSAMSSTTHVKSFAPMVRRAVQTVQPISVIDNALVAQARIATPTWITADDLLKMAKANVHATRSIAVALGQVVQVGDTMMVSYSALNTSRDWVQVLIPQIQIGNPVQKKPSKKGIMAAGVSIQDYRQNVAKLAPGERLDGVVQFSRPGFKQLKETLLLQIAEAKAVDHPVMIPLPFVAPGF